MLKYCAIDCLKVGKRAVAQRGMWQSPAVSVHLLGAFEAHVYTDIRALPAAVGAADDVFISPDFLCIMAETAAKNRRFGAIVFRKQGHTVGFMPFQVYHFKAHESLFGTVPPRLWRDRWKYHLSKYLQFRTLIVGNLHTTGPHTHWFDAEKVPAEAQKSLITEGVGLVKQVWAEKGQLVQAVFIKDFETPQAFLTAAGFHGFQVEPHFSFDIKRNWARFEDYLADLSSKYRIRAKRAFKKKQGITTQELSAEALWAHRTDLNRLFQSVAQQAAFNLVDLEEGYFHALKAHLGSKCRIFAYFKDSQMVGFYTLIRQNETALEAHFLGYDAQYNHEHQLYLNMLYDMVRHGIEDGMKRIHFGRTANEIKSSIGATAQPMFLYYRPENKILRQLFPLIFKWLNPTLTEWQPRMPFKTAENASEPVG